MATASGRRSSAWWHVTLGAALVASALGPPGRAAAADEPQILPGLVVSGVTVDLDRDGAREVVRLLDTDDPGLTVDAWGHREGSWQLIGTAEAPPPRESVAGFEIGALLSWRVEGIERALLVSAASEGEFYSTCCLTFAEVVSAGNGITLRPIAGEAGGAQEISTVDVDGDGTDELKLLDISWDGEQDPGTSRLEVLRLGAGGFTPIYDRVEGEAFMVTSLGDTDGIDGSEILVQAGEGTSTRRLAWDGERMVEAGRLELGGRGHELVYGAVGGRVVTFGSSGLRVLRWPRGGPAVEVARLASTDSQIIGIVGDGGDAVVVVGRHSSAGPPEPVSTVYDLQLQELGEVEASESATAIWKLLSDPSASEVFNLTRSIYPWDGPLPFAIDGRSAYVARGTLVQPGGPAGFETRRVGSLIGVQPLGAAGPRDAYVALGTGIVGTSATAYLYGDPIGPWESRVVMTTMSDVLTPDAEMAQLAIEVQGAVEAAGGSSLLASADGFQVVVSAPPGTIVLISPDYDELVVGNEPLVIDVVPRGRTANSQDQRFDRVVLMLTPNARGSAVVLEGTFVREPPELVARATTDLFSLRSRISGRASQGVTVIVDGVPVEHNPYGAFNAEVDAPIWPREIVVVARDAVGNETASRLEIVGFIDYRGLPWVPILGVATIAGGIFLFIRTPRRRSTPSAEWGDGALEEIDAERPAT